MKPVLAVVASALVLAAPAAAQDGGMPTELWSEYPLAERVERSSTPSVGPFLPPSDAEAAPASGDAQTWRLWALAGTVGVVALLVATRLRRPTPATRGHDRSRPVQLRPHAHPRPSPKPLPQYAPSPSRVVADAPAERRRSVVRRTGLLRSCYVVFEGYVSGEGEEVAASRSFWNVGGAALRERLAEEAWDDLINDLRVTGWEPEPTRRSDFYVLLQPVEPEPDVSSIVPTLEAYGRGDDAQG